MPDAETTAVLDASALMAVLHDEDGAEAVIDAITQGAAISVANWAEVLSKLAESGRDPERAAREARKAEGSKRALTIEPLTAADCIAVARLRPITKAQVSRSRIEPASPWRRGWAFRR